MSRTLPASFTTKIAAEAAGKFIELYQFLLPSATKYWAREAITFGGQAYAEMVYERSSIVEAIGGREDGFTVTLLNIDGTLRTLILAGEFLDCTVRLYLGDPATGDNFLLFEGRAQNPEDASEERVQVKVEGLMSLLRKTPAPRRLTSPYCPWIFGPVATTIGTTTPCGYAGPTTTAVGAGASSTSLTVASAALLANALYRQIKIGSGAAVKITAISGTTVTLEAARTWSNADNVSFTDCRKTYGDCTDSVRTHEYGGFRGIRQTVDIVVDGRAGRRRRRRRGRQGPTWNTRHVQDLRALPVDEGLKPIPILYGRRLIQPLPIELVHYTPSTYGTTGDFARRNAAFYLCHAGETENVNTPFDKVWVEGKLITNQQGGAASNHYPKRAVYMRLGVVGANDTETEAEYAADSLVRVRSQNKDFQSLAGSTYPFTVYALFVSPSSGEVWGEARRVDTTQEGRRTRAKSAPQMIVRSTGKRVQKYTSGGATDGATTLSTNPIWCLLDFLLDARNGAGISSSLIDWASWKSAADYCDVVVPSVEADTKATATTSGTTVSVVSTAGFYRFAEIYKNNAATGKYVSEVTRATELTLDASLSVTSGDRIHLKPPRFTCNLYITERSTAEELIDDFLTGCRGYITTHTGKLRVFVDQAIASTGTWADVGFSDRKFIVPGRGNFSIGNNTDLAGVNQVEVDYFTEFLRTSVDDKVTVRDEAHQFLHPAEVLSIDCPGVHTTDGAVRIAKYHLYRARNLKEGCKAKLFLSGLLLTPGDRIAVTHNAAGWTTQDQRVTRLSIEPDLHVVIDCEDYDETVYTDLGEPSEPGVDAAAPTITLTIDDSRSRQLELSWTVSTAAIRIRHFQVYVTTVGAIDGTDPEEDYLVRNRLHRRQWTYLVPRADRNTTHYVRIVGVTYDGRDIVSNQASALENTEVGSPEQSAEPDNALAYPDFNDTTGWTAVDHYPDTATELLTDPGFESVLGGGNVNWDRQGDVAIYSQTSAPHGGTYSVQFDDTTQFLRSRPEGAGNQYFQITVGATYRIKFWMLYLGTSPAKMKWCLRLFATQGADNPSWNLAHNGDGYTPGLMMNGAVSEPAFDPTSSYAEYAATFTVQGGEPGLSGVWWAAIDFQRSNASASYSIRIDDASFKKLDDAPPSGFLRSCSIHSTKAGSGGPAARNNRVVMTDVDPGASRYDAFAPTVYRAIPNRTPSTGIRKFRKGGWLTSIISIRYAGTYSAGTESSITGPIKICFFNGPETGTGGESEFHLLFEIPAAELQAAYLAFGAANYQWFRYGARYNFPGTSPVRPDTGQNHIWALRCYCRSTHASGYGGSWEFDKAAMYRGKKDVDGVLWLPHRKDMDDGYDGDFDDDNTLGVWASPAQGGAHSSGEADSGTVYEIED